MATSAKLRLKKLEKKNKKRKTAKQGAMTRVKVTKKAVDYAEYPIHESLVPNNLFTMGAGTVVISRITPNDDIAICAFMVDAYCLGVKNSLFTVVSKVEYERSLRPGFAQHLGEEGFDFVEPAYLRKLIEGAVSYSKILGFSPHPDYKANKAIFGDIDSSQCEETFEYGKDGKPFYFQGPNESPADVRRIITTLGENCGPDNFHYMFGDGEFTG